MTRVMDYDTAAHFYRWLESTVSLQDQHDVEQGIHEFLREHPTMIEEGRSWPEIRSLAERRNGV